MDKAMQSYVSNAPSIHALQANISGQSDDNTLNLTKIDLILIEKFC